MTPRQILLDHIERKIELSTISDRVTELAVTTLRTPLQIRDGRVVPNTADISSKNQAVKLDATYLYADLAGSSTLAQLAQKRTTAKIIRSYINSASVVLKNYGGEIRSFDGDRVMAIFIGDAKNSQSVRAALAIHWAVQKVLKPKIQAEWPELSKHWTIKHGIGIDTGECLIARGGARESSDLISVGSAANVAAKLSDIRTDKALHITSAVYARLSEPTKMDDSVNMWTKSKDQTFGGKTFQVYASNYHWRP